jgi:hypothetical protein
VKVFLDEVQLWQKRHLSEIYHTLTWVQLVTWTMAKRR